MYDDQGPITTNPSKDQPLAMTIGVGQLAAMQTSTFWSSLSRNLSTTLNKKKTALLLLIQIKLDWMKSIILILTAIYWKTSYGGEGGGEVFPFYHYSAYISAKALLLWVAYYQ